MDAASPSPALLAANRRLYELRARPGTEPDRPPASPTRSPQERTPPAGHAPVSILAAAAALPAHLGWESEAVTRLARAALLRREQCQVGYLPREESAAARIEQPRPGGGSAVALPDETQQKPQKEVVTHYPSLGLAALRAGQAPLYQVWLAGRCLDEAGRGWLVLADVRQQLAGSGRAEMRLFGWRRLRQVLGQGDGRYWRWDKEGGRLWLFGAARLAASLGVERLAGRPVLLPVAALTANIAVFKAHLYAAWHSGCPGAPGPIARATQQQLTGLPPRTQRHYDRVAKVKRQPNIAIGGIYSQETAQTCAWQRGQALFVFQDTKGRQGRPGGRYLAWQLPSTYRGPHQPRQRRGRQRKINQKLKVLVDNVAQGNSSSKPVECCYLTSGRAAAQAYNRNPYRDVYWQGRHTAGRFGSWHVLTAQTEVAGRQ